VKRITKSIAVFCLAASAVCAQTTPAPQVRFKTNIGDIDVTLAPDVAPATVANFLNYVNKGAYANSIFHRSVPGFIIQGGGFKLVDGVPTVIPEDTAVVNEYKISNTRGTISMAKLGDNPNSATNQWFFNLADNSGNLDNQNGGFTAFGRVTSSSSLTIMDRIAGLPIQNLGAPLIPRPTPVPALLSSTTSSIFRKRPPLPSRALPVSFPALPAFPPANSSSSTAKTWARQPSRHSRWIARARSTPSSPVPASSSTAPPPPWFTRQPDRSPPSSPKTWRVAPPSPSSLSIKGFRHLA